MLRAEMTGTSTGTWKIRVFIFLYLFFVINARFFQSEEVMTPFA